MQRLRFKFIGALLLLSLGMPSIVAAQPVASPAATATPSAKPTISFVLPTEAQVPNGLVMISDGERTLSDVASGFSDPTAAAQQFTAWGWQGNVVRAFHLPSGTKADPRNIDGIYISVHKFGSPEFAAKALDYSFEVHAGDTNLKEISLTSMGDYSRTLYGKLSYGNEATLYVQQGNYLIRLSAASPTGDPRAEATTLMQTLLEEQLATPAA